MPLPLILIPVAISAIRYLIQLRGKADAILSIGLAAEELPFLLPDGRDHGTDARDKMLAYFTKPANQDALHAAGIEEIFKRFEKDPLANIAAEDVLIRAYYIATRVVDVPNAEWPRSREQRLAMLMVGSERLSSNSTTSRLLVVTAQTLASFAGENAAFLLSNTRVQALVTPLLLEFSQLPALDEDGAGAIFRRLLGAAVTSAIENQSRLPKHPALPPLVTAAKARGAPSHASLASVSAGTPAPRLWKGR